MPFDKTLKTFNEWSNLGYKIIKGSKATWVDGIAKFSEKQVQKHKTTSHQRHTVGDMYSDFDSGDLIGYGFGEDWGM